MTTIVVKKEREGCKIFPLKRQKNTDQGELVPPGIRFFSGKGGRVPLIYIKPPPLGGDSLAKLIARPRSARYKKSLPPFDPVQCTPLCRRPLAQGFGQIQYNLSQNRKN